MPYLFYRITVFALLPALFIAQIPDTAWTKTYGGPLDDFGMSLQQTSDSGYIICGWTESFGSGNVDVYLIKTNANGDTVWTQTYGGPQEDGGNWVEQISDNGYIMAGHTYSYGAGMFDVYLIKTDSLGAVQWTKTYGGYLYDQAWCIKETPGGGYIVAGFTGISDPLFDFWLLRIDDNGDTLWTKIFGTTLVEWCNSVCVTPDSGYILAGYTGYFGNYNVYLVKTDKNGNMQWTKTYGGYNDDYAWSAIPTSDNGYVAVGWTESFGAGDTDVYFIKMDENGDTLWTKTYGGPLEDKALSVREIPDVGYIIFGSTFSYGMGGADFYLIKTDLDGSTLWTKTIGGPNWDRAHIGHLTPDEGYVIAGFTSSFGTGGTDVWLVKTQPDVGIMEYESPHAPQIVLQVSPNPFTHSTDIRYQTSDIGQNDTRGSKGGMPEHQQPVLRIYNAVGQLVKSFSLPTTHCLLPTVISWSGIDDANRRLPSGVYFLSLHAGSNFVRKKVILMR